MSGYDPTAAAGTSSGYDPTRDDYERATRSTSDASADERQEDGPGVGDVVAHGFFDPYSGAGGAEVERLGVVTAVTDEGVAVAWLPPSTDPIPAGELRRV